MKDIALILGKHGFHQVADAIQAPVRSRLRRLLKREPLITLQQPQRLRMALEELGPTFIKFGQILSTRPDLLPVEYTTELGKLQDDVGPEPFTSVQETLEAEFEGAIGQRFREIDPVPVATASIAQVHRATTREGQSVVVKVRKQGLERVINQDLWVLHLLAEFLAGWPGLRLFDPEGVVRYFERSLRRELDFDYERYNAVRMRENLGVDSRVYVPLVHHDLSTSRVLTMEFLEGRKLSVLRDEPLPPDEAIELGTAIAVSVLTQIFEHGFYHADPHPGNFILMSDGRVGLIDFGNAGKFTTQMIDDLLVLIVTLIRRNFDGLARWILKQGRPAKEVDPRELASELMDVLDPAYGVSLGDIRVGPLVNSLFEILVRHAIALPAQYVHVGRTLVTLEGVLRSCSPGLEILPTIRPYASRLFRSRWSPERLLREVRGEVTELFGSVRAYPRQIADILTRVSEGRLEVNSSIRELARVDKDLKVISTRVPLALVSCGLLVSSSILMLVDTGAAGNLPLVAGIGGYVVALLLGIRLFLKS